MDNPSFIDPARYADLPLTSATERAWAAGFFDGEGCCGAYTCRPHNRRTRVQLSICQNETGTLRRFHDAIGSVGALHSVPARPGCPNVRWDIVVTAIDDVEQVTLALWPFLSEPKRTQIQQAFETRALNSQRPQSLAHPGQKLTDEQVADILSLLAAGGIRQRDIAAMYGVGQQTVSRIALGRRKKDGQRERAGRKPGAPTGWPVTSAGQVSDAPEFIDAPSTNVPVTERAWAAGFFDAEGFTTARLGRYLGLGITQTNTETLDRFARAVGGHGTIYARNEPQPEHWKQRWQYQVTARATWFKVVSTLWEFLGQPKREQIIKAYASREATLTRT